MAALTDATMDKLTALQQGWSKHLRTTIDSDGERPEQRDWCSASMRSHCVRKMALDLIHPKDWSAMSDDRLASMERGRDRGRDIVVRLHDVGRRSPIPFEVVEGERYFRIKDRDGTPLIAGKYDCVLRWEDREKTPAEVKSGITFQNCESIEDLDRGVWTCHAVDQLLAYLYDKGAELGFFIIDRPGTPTFIPVRLEDHLARAEAFLRDARRAIDARFDRAPLPDFTNDTGLCRRCDHASNGTCVPPVLAQGDGVKILSDPELERQLKIREETKPDQLRYNRAHAKVQKALRGVTHGICGSYEIKGRWSPRKTTSYPDDITAKLERWQKQYTTSVEFGSFNLTIENMEKRETEDATDEE